MRFTYSKKTAKYLDIAYIYVIFAMSIRQKFFYIMKHSELIRALKKAGCLLKRHGASHDIWINPKTGARTAVPRHGSKEIKEKTAKSILDDLLKG